jgi:hypothetical protein
MGNRMGSWCDGAANIGHTLHFTDDTAQLTDLTTCSGASIQSGRAERR